MGIQQFDATEKRLVRLENNLSTITRYLFRLGARVPINCVYWGGTSSFEKYRAIRCMKDDRVGDGALVQIDQCLTCTRFEPIFGQVYEVMNDIGVNVAQVLDDLQASYMNNEEYIRMSRVEEYITSPKKGKFDLTKILKDQGNDSKGLDDIWGEGIKMNWSLVPVEKQKPHINWRQSINNDGSTLGRLASWQDINSGNSAAITNAFTVNNTTGSSQTNVYLKNQKSMDANAGKEECSSYIEEGRNTAESAIDEARTDYENNHSSIKDAIGNSADLDIIAVLSASIALNTTDYSSIVNQYRQMSSTINSNNPALIWTAYNTSSTIVKMYVNKTLPAYISNQNQQNGGSRSNSGSSSYRGDGNDSKTATVSANYDPETALWTDAVILIKKGLEKNGTKSPNGLSLFPKICYLYVKLMNDVKNSSFDGDGWGFPYTEDVINGCNEKIVALVGRYGEQRATHVHEGVDIQPVDLASNPDKDVPFVAVKSGIVRDAGNPSWCNCIYIDHGDGTFSRYLHCRSVLVQKDQQVQKGQVIGITGGSNGSNERAYPVHLHIEFGNVISGLTPYERTYRDNCGIDPLSCWRSPNGTDPVAGCPTWQL